MKAIVTVIGKDSVGIIALVSQLLAERGVNVLDISQTVLQDYFTMIMLVDASAVHRALRQPGRRARRRGREPRTADTHPARGHLQRDAQNLSLGGTGSP